MIIISHRGIFDSYPENSLEAIEQAWEKGFGVEYDLRLTKDGDFVVIHDENFLRLTGRDLPVNYLNLNEAEQLTYSESLVKITSWRNVLEQYQKKGKDTTMAIHIKEDALTEKGLKKIASYWKEFNLYSNSFVFGLTFSGLEILKGVDQNILSSFIISEEKFDPTIYLWEEVKNLNFDVIWAAEWRNFFTSKIFNEFKNSGKTIYAVSPDVHKALGHPLAINGYQETWNNLINYEVHGICTDKSLELESLLKK